MIDFIRDQPFVRELQSRGADIYFVGGCVRDQILGRPTKDVDLLVRRLYVDTLCNVLDKYGSANVVGTDLRCAIKFVPSGCELPEPLDITIPRYETSTGEGHRDFKIELDPEGAVEEDLARRDFTMNALAMPVEGGDLIDPHGGMTDIKTRMIRVLHARSFEHDPLRMLRGVRFRTQLDPQGFTLSGNTATLMRDHAHLIRHVSAERVAEELVRILRAPKPSIGFYEMRSYGLLTHVLPEVQALTGVKQPNKHHLYDAFDHVMVVLDAARSDAALQNPGDMNLMLSALCHDLGKPSTYTEDPETGAIHFHSHQVVSRDLTRRIFERIPFHAVKGANVDPATVARNARLHMDLMVEPEDRDSMSPRAMRRLIVRAGGPQGIQSLIDLRIADKRGGARPNNIGFILEFREFVRNFIETKPAFSVRDLAVDGNDVMEVFGIKPSRRVGEVLNALFERVTDEGLPNEREALLAVLRELKEEP